MTVYRMCERGELENVRVSNAIRIPVRALERFLGEGDNGHIWTKFWIFTAFPYDDLPLSPSLELKFRQLGSAGNRFAYRRSLPPTRHGCSESDSRRPAGWLCRPPAAMFLKLATTRGARSHRKPWPERNSSGA
jgi:hypothetical protein